MEILLDIENSRSSRAVVLPAEITANVFVTLMDAEFEKINENINLTGLSPSHVLMKWSKKWERYIIFDSVSELSEGDHVTAVARDVEDEKDKIQVCS